MEQSVDKDVKKCGNLLEKGNIKKFSLKKRQYIIKYSIKQSYLDLFVNKINEYVDSRAPPIYYSLSTVCDCNINIPFWIFFAVDESYACLVPEDEDIDDDLNSEVETMEFTYQAFFSSSIETLSLSLGKNRSELFPQDVIDRLLQLSFSLPILFVALSIALSKFFPEKDRELPLYDKAILSAEWLTAKRKSLGLPCDKYLTKSKLVNLTRQYKIV